VVDTPPTGGDEVRSLLQHMPDLYGSVIVTQPNDLSLLGITRTLNMLRKLDSPAGGILSNMAGYRCPTGAGGPTPSTWKPKRSGSWPRSTGCPTWETFPSARRRNGFRCWRKLWSG